MRTFSEEHKRKIGEANKIALKGRPLSVQAREAHRMKYTGVPRPPHVVEAVRQASILNKYHLNLHKPDVRRRAFDNLPRGSKHHNWQGGKSFEPYGKEFSKYLKEKVRERDGYKCRVCAIAQSELPSRLTVHHIDKNKTNNSISNLMSLCKKCHAHIHVGDFHVKQIKSISTVQE